MFPSQTAHLENEPPISFTLGAQTVDQFSKPQNSLQIARRAKGKPLLNMGNPPSRFITTDYIISLDCQECARYTQTGLRNKANSGWTQTDPRVTTGYTMTYKCTIPTDPLSPMLLWPNMTGTRHCMQCLFYYTHGYHGNGAARKP